MLGLDTSEGGGGEQEEEDAIEITFQSGLRSEVEGLVKQSLATQVQLAKNNFVVCKRYVQENAEGETLWDGYLKKRKMKRKERRLERMQLEGRSWLAV